MVLRTKNWPLGLLAGLALGASAPALATPVALIPGPGPADSSGSPGDDAGNPGLPYIQCVPFARKASGIQLYGDARTWWDQAAGRYERGFSPKVGAVMSFRPYGAMRLGHVAMVSRIVDSRTVLLRHANWSPINGVRGQAETDVRAVDVSDANDWSAVRVWYAPIQNLGSTHWPVDGFIYNRNAAIRSGLTRDGIARDSLAPPPRLARATTPAPQGAARIGADFLKGAVLDTGPAAPRRTWLVASAVKPAATGRTSTASRTTSALAAAPSTAARLAVARADDPIGRIIASRMGAAGTLAGASRLR